MKNERSLRSFKYGDAIFSIINIAIMVFVIAVCAYPLYYCIVISFNEGNDAMKGFIYFWPRVFTLQNYKIALSDSGILNAYFITVARTLVGTATCVYFNAMVAYALIKKELMFRKVYVTIGIITMFFSGGMIPSYLLMKQLHLIDNFLVYIIPSLSYFFNILLYMAFFREIPSSMIESAKLDGANEFYIFIRIILPVSTAVLATIALFTGVGHWNAWYDTYIYTNTPKLKTMTLVLMEMINKNLAVQILKARGITLSSDAYTVSPNSLRIATMLITIVPIMCVYPFLQKYFAKGILVGSIRG